MITREVTTLASKSGAVFSDCMLYRYRLWRVWDESLPVALLLMMNPSTADEVANDPTVERQQRRVMQWPALGLPAVGGLEVCNAFAYRETDSTKLDGLHASGFDLVGHGNDAAIVEVAQRAAITVCGWGKPGALGGRDKAVLRLLRSIGVTPYALAINKDGTPKHPLYVGYSKIPLEIPE